jgi:DNA ligase (NAD+)
MEPVKLAGTIVKRSTLHNADYIKSLDLHYGDYVYVEKAGEIIPQVVGVEVEKREQGAKRVLFPQNCPECGARLERNETEAIHYCPNEDGCPPQIKGKIEHFISRKAMDIGGGAATVELLYNTGLVRNIADLYDLKYEDIIKLERFADKSARNLLQSIEKSKKAAFHKVLYGLGIRYVGESLSKILAKNFKNIDSLMAASFEELTAVPEVGDKIARSIIDYFSDQKHIELIKRLRSAGLRFEEEETKEKDNKLLGKKFVISGNFGSPQRRKELERMVEEYGGKKQSSVGKSTDFIIAGQNAGESKLKKAEELGISVISESDFLKMIE